MRWVCTGRPLAGDFEFGFEKDKAKATSTAPAGGQRYEKQRREKNDVACKPSIPSRGV